MQESECRDFLAANSSGVVQALGKIFPFLRLMPSACLALGNDKLRIPLCVEGNLSGHICGG